MDVCVNNIKEQWNQHFFSQFMLEENYCSNSNWDTFNTKLLIILMLFSNRPDYGRKKINTMIIICYNYLYPIASIHFNSRFNIVIKPSTTLVTMTKILKKLWVG